jgi:hypothetical protein
MPDQAKVQKGKLNSRDSEEQKRKKEGGNTVSENVF